MKKQLLSISLTLFCVSASAESMHSLSKYDFDLEPLQLQKTKLDWTSKRLAKKYMGLVRPFDSVFSETGAASEEDQTRFIHLNDRFTSDSGSTMRVANANWKDGGGNTHIEVTVPGKMQIEMSLNDFSNPKEDVSPLSEFKQIRAKSIN